MIVRRLASSLLLAMIIPSVLFYLCLVVGDIWVAFAAALAWCYGAMLWRVRTRRRCSGLLWLTAIGLTAKTAFSLFTGSTFFYFLQPALTDLAIALIFFVSLAFARPMVARLAGDFFPMTDEVAARPRIKRLFWHLTLLWAFLCLVQAGVTVWLLQAMSLSAFVAARMGVTTGVAVAGAAVTVAAAARIARSEQLLHPRRGRIALAA